MFLFIIYKYIFIKDRLFSADFFFTPKHFSFKLTTIHVRIRVEEVGAACNFFFNSPFLIIYIFKVKKRLDSTPGSLSNRFIQYIVETDLLNKIVEILSYELP